MSRISSKNLSVSAPERVKETDSELKINHHDIENHLESELIFELGFIGETFSSLDLAPQIRQWKELETIFSNPDNPLPLLKRRLHFAQGYSSIKMSHLFLQKMSKASF
jgi:hypothetical protein